MQGKKLVQKILAACSDKQGKETICLDLRRFNALANYFILTSGTSERQVSAIANHVVSTLRDEKTKPYRVEGLNESRWVLVDYSDVIVHVFHQETRQFYNLERLWGDAPRISDSQEEEENEGKS